MAAKIASRACFLGNQCSYLLLYHVLYPVDLRNEGVPYEANRHMPPAFRGIPRFLDSIIRARGMLVNIVELRERKNLRWPIIIVESHKSTGMMQI